MRETLLRLRERLVAGGVEVRGSLVNRLKGFEGFTAADHDGNLVEFVYKT